MLLFLVGCVLYRKGQLVSSVQLIPATLPLTQGEYEIGPWVSAEGCDYVDTEFHVSDLIFQAQGSYDGLVNITIEQTQEIRYIENRSSGQIGGITPGNAYCYRINAQAIRIKPPQPTPAAE